MTTITKRFKQIIKTGVLLNALLLLPIAASSNAFAGEHAMFQIFFSKGTHTFPATVSGKYIEQKMRDQGFDIMISTQSASLKDGDVWTLQTNTLRLMDKVLVDFGVECHLSMKTHPIKTAGLCKVHMGPASDKNSSTSHIITAIEIKNPDLWHKLFEDKKNGIAAYMSKETSNMFNQ